IVVNGDVRTADDVVRALVDTGCAAVMIGRAAIAHPWIFREARALLDGGPRLAPPTARERVAAYHRVLLGNVAARGEKFGVPVTRRHLGLLGEQAAALRGALFAAPCLSATTAVLAAAAGAAMR